MGGKAGYKEYEVTCWFGCVVFELTNLCLSTFEAGTTVTSTPGPFPNGEGFMPADRGRIA